MSYALSADIRRTNASVSKTEQELRELATQLARDPCAHFLSKICNEVPGLHFDGWCDPCKARRVIKALNTVRRRRMVLAT